MLQCVPTSDIALGRILAAILGISVIFGGQFPSRAADPSLDFESRYDDDWSAVSLLQVSLDAEYGVTPVAPRELTTVLSLEPDIPFDFSRQRSPSSRASLTQLRAHQILSEFHQAIAQDDLPPRSSQAERAFAYLHQRLLVGPFAASCPHVRETLETGRHNCLTSTVLYIALCRSIGIQARAVAMTGHVNVRITTSDGSYDVETTSRRWLRQPTQSVGQVISDRRLLARVYYNLGLAYAQQNAYARSVAATHRSFELDPRHQRSRDNLLATLNNWALSLVSKGQLRAAEAVISSALALDGDHPGTRETSDYVRRMLQPQNSTSSI